MNTAIVLLASLNLSGVLVAMLFISFAVLVVASLFVPLPQQKGRQGNASRTNPESQYHNAVYATTTAARARPANGCPSGTYLNWPIPLSCVLLLLGLGGAVVGSGGTVEGFLFALMLNPLIWIAGGTASQIGRIRCPHCRKSSELGVEVNHPVGIAIACSHCGNDFAKPPG
jgi:hypothetical protein